MQQILVPTCPVAPVHVSLLSADCVNITLHKSYLKQPLMKMVRGGFIVSGGMNSVWDNSIDHFKSRLQPAEVWAGSAFSPEETCHLRNKPLGPSIFIYTEKSTKNDALSGMLSLSCLLWAGGNRTNNRQSWASVRIQLLQSPRPVTSSAWIPAILLDVGYKVQIFVFIRAKLEVERRWIVDLVGKAIYFQCGRSWSRSKMFSVYLLVLEVQTPLVESLVPNISQTTLQCNNWSVATL